MPIELYGMLLSPPCRSILMLGRALGIEIDLKVLDLMKGEHMTPEFLKLNPQHCIPTLDDDGVVLWESRAILCYLVNKYGKTDSLYPKDPQKRARIDQMLYFDMGTLYQRFSDYYYPQMFAKAPADVEKYKRFEEAMDFLDIFLTDRKYACGEYLTIADMALMASVSTIEVADVPIETYPHVKKWYELCKKTTPGADMNTAGALEFKPFFDSIKS